MTDPQNPTWENAIYIDRLQEEYPQQWERFLNANRELVAELDLSLQYLAKCIVLLKQITTDACEQGEFGQADRIESQYNVSGRFVVVWSGLNPLLRQAALQMRRFGIDPTKYGGWTADEFCRPPTEFGVTTWR